MASQLLFHAVNHGDLQQCQCLILEGCADVNYRNSLGESVVHIAAMRGMSAVMELLLSCGADPNVTRHEEFGGCTPLHVSVEKGFIRISEVLLSHNADPNIPDSMAMLPLHYTARSGNEELALLLISHGSRLDSPDEFGKPPNYYAVNEDNMSIAAHLPTFHYNWREIRQKEISKIHWVEKDMTTENRPGRKKSR